MRWSISKQLFRRIVCIAPPQIRSHAEDVIFSILIKFVNTSRKLATRRYATLPGLFNNKKKLFIMMSHLQIKLPTIHNSSVLFVICIFAIPPTAAFNLPKLAARDAKIGFRYVDRLKTNSQVFGLANYQRLSCSLLFQMPCFTKSSK